MIATNSPGYNSDDLLCRQCDEEPVVYNGLCESCLYDEKDSTEGWKKPASLKCRSKKKRNTFELDNDEM